MYIWDSLGIHRNDHIFHVVQQAYLLILGIHMLNLISGVISLAFFVVLVFTHSPFLLCPTARFNMVDDFHFEFLTNYSFSIL